MSLSDLSWLTSPTHTFRDTLILVLINGLHVELPTGLEVGRRSGSETPIVCPEGPWKM